MSDGSKERVVAALAILGWTDAEDHEGGEFVLFTNPDRPDSPIVWQADGKGNDLAEQINLAGVSRKEWESAIQQVMSADADGPYGSVYDF